MNVRLGPERRPFRVALKLMFGIALLGLPALRAVAQAQTGKVPCFQQHCAKASSTDDLGFFAAIPARSDAPSTAAAVGRAEAGNSVSGESPGFTLIKCGNTALQVRSASPETCIPQFSAAPSESLAARDDRPADDSKSRVLSATSRRFEPADFNRSIYYRNKLEFSWESGWLPGNIPFVFALFIGHQDKLSGLNYTLVPFIASIRWHMTKIRGPWILRGNWDMTFSGTYTMIPRGPETRYWAYLTGFRRNFIQPNWRIVPYLEGRAGLGDINAKGPYASKSLPEENRGQGQDFAFTVMLGGGARYNFNSRFSLSAGVAYIHISNLYLSEPKYLDEGINVYGPIVGINVRLGKPKR